MTELEEWMDDEERKEAIHLLKKKVEYLKNSTPKTFDFKEEITRKLNDQEQKRNYNSRKSKFIKKSKNKKE